MIALPMTIFGVFMAVILALNDIYINSTLWWAILISFWASNAFSIILTEALHKGK